MSECVCVLLVNSFYIKQGAFENASIKFLISLTNQFSVLVSSRELS